MALAAMRSEIHIVKFKMHPTGQYRECAICKEICNNTEHVLLHCPASHFVWSLAADIVIILTGIKVKLDPKLIMLNFTDNLSLSKASKKIIKFVNTIFVITRRILFTLYYRGDGTTNSLDIIYE